MQPEETLADHPEYQEVWTHFPKDTIPFFYMELAHALDYLKKEMAGYEQSGFEASVGYLKPVTIIAAGSSPFQDNQVHSIVIIFVEGAEGK